MTKPYNSRELVCARGWRGGVTTKENGKTTKSYKTWKSMLERCYSVKYQASHPTYIGCSVCDEWLYFPTFAEWFDDNYIEGYELDKDLLIKNNKVYGPHTCIFTPHAINTLFLDRGRARGEWPIGVHFHKRAGKFMACVKIDGKRQHLGYFNIAEDAHTAYIIAKKAYVIKVANEWKNRIPTKLYCALIQKAEE